MKSTAILQKRFEKLQRHQRALSDYHSLIQELLEAQNVLTVERFEVLPVRDKALFDAYIKRFASIQDYLGAKIFPLLAQLSGIDSGKMTDTLALMEREEVIDSLEVWIELRQIRNELEHDYPEELVDALEDLSFCIQQYDTLIRYIQNSQAYAKRFLHATL